MTTLDNTDAKVASKNEEDHASIKSYSTHSTVSSYRSVFRSGTDEDYIDTYITIPPDGGWGWIVVAASFLCSFVSDGAIYTFGIFLEEISETFEVEATEVAVASSLMNGCYYLTGPITCALVNRLGFQGTGFFGGVVSASAFMFGSMTTSVHAFLVVFGVIGGFGFGLVYVPSVVVIGFYFEKWRALATSIAVTGSAAGIVGFPIMIKNLMSDYKWQTKFKFISGLCLIIGFLALLYRPIKPTRVLTTKDKKVVQFLEKEESAESFRGKEKTGIFRKIYNRFHNKKYPTHIEAHKNSTLIFNFPPGPSTSSVFIKSVPEGSSTTFMRHSPSKTDGRSERLEKLSTVFENADAGGRKKCKERLRKLCFNYKCCKWCCAHSTENRPMYRDDIFYGASLYNLPSRTSKLSKVSKRPSFDYTLSVTRTEILKEGKEERVHCKCCPESIVRTLVTMLHLQLLKSIPFVILAISGFFTLLGMFIPFIYLVERANENKMDQEISVHLFTALGTANAAGRIISGVLASLPSAKPLIVSYVSITICGVATIISYFFTDVYSQFVYIAVFGLTIASVPSLRTPIVVELLGLENLTNAFGLLLVFHGVAGFLGMPIAGSIVAASGSYNMCFIFSGCTITLSAILLMPIKHIADWQEKKLINSNK